MQRHVAHLLIAAGAAALLGVTVAYVDGTLGERRARDELAAQLSAPVVAPEVSTGHAPSPPAPDPGDSPPPASDTGDFPPPAPDVREWSATRRAEWEASHRAPAGTPLGLLAISSLGLSVVVFEDTDTLSLNRGVGRIAGTRMQSNLGIAGHRDGYFRPLRKLTKGARIDLETRDAIYTYEVRSLSIVSPEDVHVLDPTPGPTLTLVTCYPFFVLGPAPKRFVVHAVRVAESGRRPAQPRLTPSSQPRLTPSSQLGLTPSSQLGLTPSSQLRLTPSSRQGSGRPAARRPFGWLSVSPTT